MKFKKLLAGPNLMIRVNEHNLILNASEIDLYLVNSHWIWIAYQKDLPSLQGRISIWPAEVDEEYWRPSSTIKKDRNVIVYVKKQPASFYTNIKNILKRYRWNPITISYENYNHYSFKETLEKSQFAVFLSRSESQGIALAECWSMNVPTLSWNIKTLHAHGSFYHTCSACPYLTEQTGLDWQNLEKFEQIIKNIESKLPYFTPREWLLENMTDKASAQILVKIIESLN